MCRQPEAGVLPDELGSNLGAGVQTGWVGTLEERASVLASMIVHEALSPSAQRTEFTQSSFCSNSSIGLAGAPCSGHCSSLLSYPLPWPVGFAALAWKRWLYSESIAAPDGNSADRHRIHCLPAQLPSGDLRSADSAHPLRSHPPRNWVVEGLHRRVRNPMYIGVLWIVLGQAALFQFGSLAIDSAALWLAFHLFVLC
jgi:hypothetical protein